MDQETRELLESCARLRAGGDSWDEASAILKRPVTELKDLAWQHRAEWAALLGEALGLRVFEAAGLALNALTRLAEHEDPYVAKDAAKTLLCHCRWQATEGGHVPEVPPGTDTGSPERSEGSGGCPRTTVIPPGEEKMISACEAASERLVDLVHAKEPWVQLRSAQSIMVSFRWWWRWTHPRPRAPQPERKPKGPDWKSILPWKGLEENEPMPAEPGRVPGARGTEAVIAAKSVSIHEDAGKPGRTVRWMGRRNGELVSWEKTGAEAQAYIEEIVKASEKPATETIWYGHWQGTHLVWLPDRETVPWPPPEEVLRGKWYTVWNEEAGRIEVRPLPESWKAGDPEPDDGWGFTAGLKPPARASPD